MQFFELLRQNPFYLLWLWLAIINLATFFIMGVDKYKAVHHKWRIPERTLFYFALLGGSLGGIASMYLFRHKTLHKKFSIGFPVVFILQIAIGFVIFYYTRT